MDIKKVEVHEGCYGTTVEIDNVEWDLIPEEDIRKYIINNIKNIKDLQKLFLDLVDDIFIDSDFKSRSACDACGAWNSTTTYKMK